LHESPRLFNKCAVQSKRRTGESIASAGFALLITFAAFRAPAEGSITNESVSSAVAGSTACSSSGCHGGADDKSKQVHVWSKLDFHSRSFATLTSARSRRFAEVLKLEAATTSPRCTVCHAPFQPLAARRPDLAVSQGVSCESCHGPARSWIRAHTRPDFSHADRVAAGMRDLRDLYGRANTCVACHQTLDPELARAGHPELIFELDGQAVSEPKHWRERDPRSGPKAWLVGQAVALREMSWQLSKESAADSQLTARWSALVWLLQATGAGDPAFPDLKSISSAGPEGFAAARNLSDEFARAASEFAWSDETTRGIFQKLAARGDDFRDAKIPPRVLARRAERLVLALDRLSLEIPSAGKPVHDSVDALFKQAQSVPDFAPASFAASLDALAKSTTGK
jgi:hypothetical protein